MSRILTIAIGFAVLAMLPFADAQQGAKQSQGMAIYLNEPGAGAETVVKRLSEAGFSRVHLFLNDSTYGQTGTPCDVPFSYSEPWTEAKIRNYVKLLRDAKITPVLTLAPNVRSSAFMDSVAKPIGLAKNLDVDIEYDLEGGWLVSNCVPQSSNFTQLRLLQETRDLAPNIHVGISVPHYNIEEYWPFISGADFISVQAYGDRACEPKRNLEQLALKAVPDRFAFMPHKAGAKLWITVATEPGNCPLKERLDLARALAETRKDVVGGITIWSWRSLVKDNAAASYVGLKVQAN
jgi:hypothetical protein